MMYLDQKKAQLYEKEHIVRRKENVDFAEGFFFFELLLILRKIIFTEGGGWPKVEEER